ncbi:MAG TPA: serine protease [Nannocystaceae bacterium]|nr:serine protease [Nannocystaceae bacterium]
MLSLLPVTAIQLDIALAAIASIAGAAPGMREVANPSSVAASHPTDQPQATSLASTLSALTQRHITHPLSGLAYGFTIFKPTAIRGEDDRELIVCPATPTTALCELQRSVPAIIIDHLDHLNYTDDALRLHADGNLRATYPALMSTKDGEGKPLCPTERFADQPRAAFCGAAVVDVRLDANTNRTVATVATAAHCVAQEKLTSRRVLFDFRGNPTDPDAAAIIPARSVCAPVVGTFERVGMIALLDISCPPDFDPPRPLTVADQKPPTGSLLKSIGYPLNLPAIFAGRQRVRDCTTNDGDFFCADFDFFPGNSGSPVIDDKTGELVGIAESDSSLDLQRTPIWCSEWAKCQTPCIHDVKISPTFSLIPVLQRRRTQ